METHSVCNICMEAADDIKRIMTSDICGHQMCTKCLDSMYQVAIRAMPANTSFVQMQCPHCKIKCTKQNWVDRNPGEGFMQQEKIARKKVFSVMNATRARFDVTPAYDDFLEERENTVHRLVYGTDEEKKSVQKHLNDYEVNNETQILEDKKKKEKEDKERVLYIVEAEGEFYEIVKEPFRPGFNYANIDKCMHPLKREYAKYFHDDDAESAAVNVGQPKPLDPNLDYNALCRQLLSAANKDKVITKDQRRAGGYFEERTLQRLYEEFINAM